MKNVFIFTASIFAARPALFQLAACKSTFSTANAAL